MYTSSINHRVAQNIENGQKLSTKTCLNFNLCVFFKLTQTGIYFEKGSLYIHSIHCSIKLTILNNKM